jgi:uncharacterized SAM-binding protein YcdF (DUF218 family)
MGARTYLARRACEPREAGAAFVVASGGRRWAGGVEADAMAEELAVAGVPEAAIVRERCSLNTIDNARFSAAILARRGLHRAAVVTCSWHLPRALALFTEAGLEVEPVAAEDGEAPPLASRVWRWGKERVLTRVSMVGTAIRGSSASGLRPSSSK